MTKACSGANGLRSIETATNSSEPPKMTELIMSGYQKPKPETFI